MKVYTMPYKRTFRKRRARRGGYSRSKKMVTGHGPTLLERIARGAGAVGTLAKAVSPVINAINTEMKFHDLTATVTAYTPGTNDQLICLTDGIAQGLGEKDRVGNSILAKDLQLRMQLSFASTLGSPNVIGVHSRWLLFCWKDNKAGLPPTIANIFEAPSNIYSPINKDQSDQMVILKDKFFSQNNDAGVAGQAGFSSVKFFKKLDWHMRFNSSASGSGTVNHIYLVLRSSGAVANALSCTYATRLNYTDN